MEHFKGIQSLDIGFSGKNASIYGDNATGKTTVMDAWMWLLTGKDSHGNAAFEIKPLDSCGNVADRSARPTVEAELDVNGAKTTLRKEYYELWTTKRGSYEATYDGNSTDYFLNGVPKTKRQYDDAVAELVPENIFRLLSDTAAFAALKWQDRRAVLFDLAEVGSDQSIMAGNPDFAELKASTEMITVEDYQAQLTAGRKKLNARLKELPARIEENRRTDESLAAIPFDELRTKADTLDAEVQRLNRAIADKDASGLTAAEARVQALRNQIDRLEIENDRFRASQGGSDSLALYTRKIDMLTRDFRGSSERYKNLSEDVETYKNHVESCREKWISVNAESFAAIETCPTCGQKLPEGKIRAARERWEAQKAARLKEYADTGLRYRRLVEQSEQLLEGCRQSMAEIEGKFAEAKDEKDKSEKRAAAISDMDNYSADSESLHAKLRSAEEELAAIRTAGSAKDRELQQKLRASMQEHASVLEQLAKESTLKAIRERISELQAEVKTVASDLAATDRALDMIDRFTRYKTNYITDGINGHFRLASFRLFTQQVNGGISSCCDILCGGVPYDGGLNNGARINVGLDIIRTLQEHYGYRVPIFVDNAESVTELENIDGQIIRLVVSDRDKELRCAN
jgi:chromosome segregation ATPase